MSSRRARGFLFVLGAAVMWSTGGLGIKLVAAKSLTIAGFRSVFAIGVLAAAFGFQARSHGLSARVAAGQLVRRPLVWAAAVGYMGMLMAFVSATKLTTAANAILLQYTAPIYVALLSWPLLRERVRTWDWVAVAGCVIGMFLFVRGDVTDDGRAGNALAILSGLCFASLPIFLRMDQKRLGSGDGALLHLQSLAPPFSMVLGNALVVLACAPSMASLPFIRPGAFAILAPLGFFQIGLAYVFYGVGVRELRTLESTVVCTLEPLLTPLWVFLAMNERPSPSACLGGAVILLAIALQGLSVSRAQPLQNAQRRPGKAPGRDAHHTRDGGDAGRAPAVLADGRRDDA